MTRLLGWTLMTVLAAAIGVYAFVMVLVPGTRGEFVLDMIARSGAGAHLHFVAGGLVLIVGALQFSAALRRRRPRLHRWLGRIYVGGVLAGATAGFYLAFFAFGGIVARLGFGLLAVGWFVTTLLAFVHIRRRQVLEHQRWMTRSYALCLAAVTLRVYLPLFAMAGIPFESAYPVIAWLSWVPNLLVAEWLLQSQLGSRPRQAPAA